MYFILEQLKENYIIWFIIIFIVSYLVLTKNHNYWPSRNVKCIPPLPLFGNSFKTAFSIAPCHQVQEENYNNFSGLPYGGILDFWKPKLMLRDPNLIEYIMIKDFSYFMDRETVADNKVDPLSNHLVNLNGNTWRVLRNKLTPVFSSGKLKTMLQQMLDCSNVLVNYIVKEITSEKPVEVREIMAGFTTDVIASCAFGLNIQSVNNPNSEFRKIGKSMFAPSKITKVRLAMRSRFGFLLRLIRWRLIPKKLSDFFMDTVKNTVKYREQNNIRRGDFIQLLMDVRKEEENYVKEGTSSEIIMDNTTMAANAFVFLVAGFETIAGTLGYVLYELSQNHKIQDKVYQEVDETLKKHKGEINWDTLKEMKYVEQVILETLRKHPPVTALPRQSVKPYKVPNSDLELPTGSVVTIPVYSLQHDPKYYPEPQKFEPERFSEENKHKLVKGTFLPFGDGPRICIGLRFAKVEMVLAIAKLILKYKFILNPKTITPIKYSADTLFLVPVGGIWIDFIPRLNTKSETEDAVV